MARRRPHLALADAAVVTPARPVESVARHLLGAGDLCADTRLVPALPAAADSAERRGDHGSAAEMHRLLGAAQRDRGNLDAAAAHLDAAVAAARSATVDPAAGDPAAGDLAARGQRAADPAAAAFFAHSARICRELQVPLVVATGDATTRLLDGERVEVDGAAGTVVLLPG